MTPLPPASQCLTDVKCWHAWAEEHIRRRRTFLLLLAPTPIIILENYPWHPLFPLAALIWRHSGCCLAAWVEQDTREALRALPESLPGPRLGVGVCTPTTSKAGSCWGKSWGCDFYCHQPPPHTSTTLCHAPQTLLPPLPFRRGLNGPCERTYQKSGILSVQSKCGE